MALTKKQEKELVDEALKQGLNMVKWLAERGFEMYSTKGASGVREYHLKEKK